MFWEGLQGVILDAFFMIFDAILNGLQGVILEAFFMILDVILDGFGVIYTGPAAKIAGLYFYEGR